MRGDRFNSQRLPGEFGLSLTANHRRLQDAAVNGGSAVTVSAQLQRNSDYSGDPPKITLTGLGISASKSMTADPGDWEELEVTDTPDAAGMLTLTVETFSTETDAKAWIDDISVSQ